MTAITNKKLRDKILKEKTLELNTYEKMNKKIPEALISAEGKQATKQEPIQSMERFGTSPKTQV